ncbi:MAG TPA: HDIG domain-containing protein [Trueperaceae bacterium]|nr:HDIG domain-containing protein [Trueperaceae bacterium]
MSSSAKAPPTSGSRYWLLSLVALACLAALLYSVHGTRQRSPLRLGQPSPQTFTAPIDTQVIDWIATQRERQAARAQIETVYTSDPELKSLVQAAVGSSGLPPAVIDAVISRYQQPSGVRAEAIPELIASTAELAPEDRQREARLVLERRLVATSVPNDRLTQAAREAAAGAVPSVMQSLEAGQVIVREGEPLDEDVLRVLDSLGLYSAQADAATQTVWIVIGCLALALLLTAPLLMARQRLMDRLTPTQVTFLVAVTLFAVAAQRLAVMASPHFLFVLLAALTASVLLGINAGLLWSAWLALAVGLLVPASPLLAMAATLVGSVVASLVVQTLRTRVALPVAGAAGGLVAGLTLLAIVTTSGGMALSSALAGAAFLFGGGLLAGVMALGLLPVAESVFGFLTDFRLLELSSPSERLMQRLIAEAPGTYQHSLVISNLVEQAVKNIGGNSLLARVGALYHDVGKTRRPQFFIENQFTGENPHDRLSPHLSYLIVTSHVRDGIELAREYGLPREIEPFIAEHHGTTVLSYFYKRALEEGQVEELNFRYPGPKPQSKETAVLMLADAIESASRTLEDPSPSTIRALIDRLFEQRRQEEQFAESPLNFNDLEVIATTFERMLTAVLHRRISYPSAEEIRGLRSTRSGSHTVQTAATRARAEVGEVDADGRDSGRDVPLPTR